VNARAPARKQKPPRSMAGLRPYALEMKEPPNAPKMPLMKSDDTKSCSIGLLYLQYALASACASRTWGKKRRWKSGYLQHGACACACACACVCVCVCVWRVGGGWGARGVVAATASSRRVCTRAGRHTCVVHDNANVVPASAWRAHKRTHGCRAHGRDRGWPRLLPAAAKPCQQLAVGAHTTAAPSCGTAACAHSPKHEPGAGADKACEQHVGRDAPPVVVAAAAARAC
jgi:hypothetical protein